MVANLGSQRCWFLDGFAAILFRTTLVMAAYPPDSGKSTEMYDAFVSSVLKEPLEGHLGGAKATKQDHNVVLGKMCTDENDIEELNVMYGPLCWQG